MKDTNDKFKLGMAVPNGIITGLIGVLVLLTPLTVEVAEHQLAMDLIAGAVLTVGGFVSLVLGLTARKRSESKTHAPPVPRR